MRVVEKPLLKEPECPPLLDNVDLIIVKRTDLNEFTPADSAQKRLILQAEFVALAA